MKKGKSSIIVIGALALVTFILVAGVLAAAQKKAPVVVAARALEAGTQLSISDVEMVQIHAGAVQQGAFDAVEDVIGLLSTVQRLPGDQITSAMVGDSAQNALAQALDPGYRAVAIDVDRASGLAGLLRPGDTVSAIGIIEQEMIGVGQTNVGAASKMMLANLKVLFVPYEFRYRELNPGGSGDTMSPVMASSADRDKGVIVLSVPVDPITVTWNVIAETPIETTGLVVDQDVADISPNPDGSDKETDPPTNPSCDRLAGRTANIAERSGHDPPGDGTRGHRRGCRNTGYLSLQLAS